MSILRTRQLSREFRGFHAVDGVDLDVAEGSVHALVGPNGAGKTTLFNLLTGFLTPTSGSFEVAGQDATGRPPERIARLGVARSFQITTLFPQLCVREHIELALQSRSGLGWRFWRSRKLMDVYTGRAMQLLAEVDLAALSESIADSLPYGRKRALELAIALALDPKVLLLDEPTAGMGTEERWRMIDMVRELWERQKITVVFIEHDMDIVFKIAQTIRVLCYGRVLAEGTPSEIRGHPEVIAAYLGTSQETRES